MTLTSYDLTGEKYHQTVEDVACLKQLASRLPHRPVIVNIGACFGTSAMAFLEERPDAFIFSVDKSICPDEVTNLKKSGLWVQHRVVRCLGRSQDIGRYWPIKADLVYVDGSHICAEVLEDIDVWLPVVKPGGVIVFHDYGKPICPGVKPAVDQRMFTSDYEMIARVDSMIAFRV